MKPNILLITTDEQHKNTIGCYGNTVIDTRNLDVLARDGMVFDQAYCANPLCSPSRCSILSGQYPSVHGCWTVGVKMPQNATSVAEILAQNGYDTAALGKMHFQPGNPAVEMSEESGDYSMNPHDFDTWQGPYYGFQHASLAIGHTCNGEADGLHYGKFLRKNGVDINRYWKETMKSVRKEKTHADTLWQLPLEYHNSTWTADITIDYLNQRAGSDKPFFAWCSFQDPHDPYRVPNPYHDKYKEKDVIPFIKQEGEIDDKPPHFRQWFYGEDPSWLFDKEGEIDSIPAGYEMGRPAKDFPEWKHRIWNSCVYGMVDLIDDQIGRVLEALEKNGQAENTIVIFTSDHGDYMGNHYFWFKGPFHYDDVVNVPMIVRWPNHVKPEQKNDSMVSLIDLAPTLLDAAGIPVPEEMDGTSFLPVLEGKADSVRDYCVIENRTTRNGLYLRTVVNESYKATFYSGKDYGELYDRKKDPNEFVNRWNDPEYQEIKAELLAIVEKEIIDESRQNIPPRIGYA